MSLITVKSTAPLVDEERNNSLQKCVRCLKRWISVVCSPLQEALAGSILLWFIFVFISICFYFLLVYVTEHEGKNSHVIADLALIMFMALGFLAQAICVCRVSNPDFVRFGKLGHEHSTMYLMAGIYVFGIGTLCTILLRILIYYHAHELIVNCQLKTIPKIPIVDVLQAGIENGTANNNTGEKTLVLFGGFCYNDVAFDVVRLLFTLLQLHFIQTFRAATFNRSVFVQFTLYHTIMTNGCVWIRYLLNETKLFQRDEYHASIDAYTIKAFHMEEIMIPFILEYSLLAAGLLYTISSHMTDIDNNEAAVGSQTPSVQDDPPTIPQDRLARAGNVHPDHQATLGVQPGVTQLVQGDRSTTPQDSGANAADVHQDHQGALGGHSDPSSGDHRPASPQDLDANATNVHRDHQAAPGSQPGLICGAFFGLLLPLSSLMFSNEKNKFSKRSHDLFLAYEGILALLQVIAIVWTLNLLQHHRRSAHKLHSEDTLLLIGYFGTFAFHWIAIYTICKALSKHTSENRGTDILTLLHLLILVVSHFLQTILVTVSRRYSLIRKQGDSAETICQLTLFMLMTNLGFWALDSFVEMKALDSFVHSAEMLYEFWSRFRMTVQPKYP